MDSAGLAWGVAALCGALLLSFAGLWLALRRRLQDLDAELSRLRAQSQRREYRIERYDVLWFVEISLSEAERKVLKVSAGLPHCKACIKPLSASGKGGQWACPGCASAYPPSLGDLAVMDVVVREALRHFQERHPDYRAGEASAVSTRA